MKGEKKKEAAVLPATLLPDQLKGLLQFFSLLDKLLCFLKKRHVACTVESVKSLARGLAMTQDAFDRSLQQLCAIREGVRMTEEGVLEFTSTPGAGKGAASQRLARLSSSLCSLVERRYCAVREADPSLPALCDVLQAGAWPPRAMAVLTTQCIEDAAEKAVAPHAKCTSSSSSSSLSLSSPPPLLSSLTSPLRAEGSSTIESLGGICAVIEHIRSLPFYSGQIVSTTTRPGRAARYGELERPLPRSLQAAVSSRLGIQRLYQHQAEGINALRRGSSLILNTSTSSGKSLIYNVPVVEAVMRDEGVVAIYLFPAKALAQDQLRALELLLGADLPVRAVAVDGDTGEREREAVREGLGNIILTNPDFLHYTLLPCHDAWSRLFRRLRYVVVDEVHLMRGAFGSHCGCILRRLLRVCMHYGSDVHFVFCSATIANAEEVVRCLVPLLGPVESICADREASPLGERTLMIWNPPMKAQASSAKEGGEGGSQQSESELRAQAREAVVDLAAAGRRSSISEMSSLLSSLVQCGLRVLAFCRVRKLVELVFKYASADLRASAHPALADRIATYRGGYSKEARREIERSIFSGRLLGITSTCALELGVDIGNMNATLHMGVPSPSSLDQQIGRCGRSGRSSLSCIVCFDTPIDQYYARNPELLWSRPSERCVIDCDNEHILRDHLLCAAAELPLNYPFVLAAGERVSEQQLWGPKFDEVSDYLVRNALLEVGQHSNLLLPAAPAAAPSKTNYSLGVSIRHIDPLSITVYDESDLGGPSIDSVGYSRAFYELYEGAVYFCRGRQYEVRKLDLQSCTAYARPVSVRYYTSSRHDTAVEVLKRSAYEGVCGLGRIQVVRTVGGYDKKWLATHEVFDTGVCVLPPLQFETRAFWIDIPVTALRLVEATGGGKLISAIHAANHALLQSSRLLLSCDDGDLETEHRPSTKPFRLLLYDQRSGGLGTCDEIFSRRLELVRAAAVLLRGCACTSDGCPSCIFDNRCHFFNKDLSKASGALLLAALLEVLEVQVSPCPDSRADAATDCFVEMSPRKRSAQDNSRQRERLMEGGRPRKLAVLSGWDGIASVVTDSAHRGEAGNEKNQN